MGEQEIKMVEEIGNHGEFDKFIEKGICVIDFWAEWCMPCLMMAPIFEEVSEKFSKIKFGKVNIEDNKELASKFNIMSIPCLIIFKSGKEADRIIGAVPAEALEEKIKAIK